MAGGGGGFASKRNVEVVQHDVKNLQTSMDALTALFVELRDQVAPLPNGVAYVENAMSEVNPVLRNGKQFNGSSQS